MKTVFFLRHAHTPHNMPLADRDRPLDEQGRAEAEAVAAYVHQKKIKVEGVLCSVALRAQETLEPLRSVLSTQDIDVSESFYNISEEKILEALTALPETLESVLYIGHNPGIAFAILKFSPSLPGFLKQGLAPATLVGLEFDVEKWEDVGWAKGRIIEVFHPKFAPPKSPVLTEL